MIKSLYIRDFRLHKKLRIDFDPRITTIVGKSYAGKSTIIRALKWICLNKPAGTSVIRWGRKQATAELTVGKNKITRIRGKGKNLYKLNGDNFEAFGNDVPAPISKLLNISENNFQGQHSLPFWFGESAGEVSRKLNGIVNLSVIDTTLSNLASMLNKARTAVEVSKDRVQEIKERKKELAFVDELSADWERVQKAQKEFEALDNKYEILSDAVERCRKYRQTIQQTRPPSLKRLTAAYERLASLDDKYTVLEIAIQRVQDAQSKLKRCKRESDRLNKELKSLTKRRCPLCGKRT